MGVPDRLGPPGAHQAKAGGAAKTPAAAAPAEPPAGAPTAGHWATKRERSNRVALQLMAFVAVRLGRPLARLLLHPITWYFLLFSPGPKRQTRRFLSRALGREPTLAEHYAQVHAFASVVLDRVYLARGETRRFAIEVQGGDDLLRLLDRGRGAFLVGAHVGSFEVLHAAGKGQHLRVAMVMFPDNARLIQGVLAAVAPQMSLEIITIGKPGSTLAIRDWLDGGGLVGVLGDRSLPETMAARGPRSADHRLPFLGREAVFNDGPFRLAQLLGREVLFMVGLYLGGNRYQVRFERLADFSPGAGALAGNGPCDVPSALAAYVARLEALARERPDNWFNFHDFWNEDAAG